MRSHWLLRGCLTLVGILCAIPVWAANPNWPKSLTIGTASPGGVYLLYGRALAELWTEKLGIPVDAVSTQGPVHNVKLTELGGAQIGLITMGVGLQGWNGTGEWTGGKRFRDMRALFPMYDTPLQILVLSRSGITKLEQLDKKRMGVGPRAGTGGTYIPDIMKLLGISPEIKYGSIADLATELLADRYEASATMTGVPVPAILDAETKEALTFISLTSEQVKIIRKAMPELSPSKIGANIYKSLSKDYDTLGVFNFAIGRADLPDDLVYQLVKAVHENQARLIKGHSSATETIPQNVDKNTFLPFHPGAVRYYREIGIQIPPQLIPAN